MNKKLFIFGILVGGVIGVVVLVLFVLKFGNEFWKDIVVKLGEVSVILKEFVYNVNEFI